MMEKEEDRLLLACLRSRHEPDALEEARRVVRGSDVRWDRFLGQVARQSVAPLIYDTLRDDTELLPSHVKGDLRAAYYRSASLNAMLFERLEELVSAFHAAGTPTILLKGAALAQGVYRNVALRPMGDVDLLVTNDTMPAAEEVLAGQGYLAQHAASPHLRHASFTRDDRGGTVCVEVHQHIVSSPYYRATIPEQWLWERPASVLIGETAGQMLAAQPAMVHCCLHFLDHTATEGTLLWLWDMVEITRNLDVDWKSLAERLAEFRIVLPVRSILQQCHELLGLPIPDHALRTILSLRPGFVERKAYQFCLSPRRSSASKLLFDFLASPGLHAKAGLLSSRLFPARHLMMTRYSIRSPRLVPLYYPRVIAEAALDGLRALGRPRGH